MREPNIDDDLYSACIIAVKPDTGEYVWHYQETPGDAWDYDAVSPMTVVDLTVDGKKRHVILQPCKNGFFYMLEAATGKLLRAVPFTNVNWADGVDMKTGRPRVKPEARFPVGKPWNLEPGVQGAHGWQANAFSPQTGLLYFPTQEAYFPMVADKSFTPNPVGYNLGLDFTGGVEMEVKTAQVIDVGRMRGDVESLGFGIPAVSAVSGGVCDQPAGSCARIRVQPPKAKPGQDANAATQAVIRAVKAKLGSAYTFRNQNVIGPEVSGQQFREGVIATILAVLCISAWVWFRFEWQYGIGALIATGHDVFVVAGFYSLFQWEFNLNTVAALLLLAGYSINDTVVVFDRIRENRRKYKRMSLRDLINLSTNNIATRTTLVSVATALSVVPLLFGGPVLLNFSRAILIGILVGTFSSTYVAVVLLFYLSPVGGRGVSSEKIADASA